MYSKRVYRQLLKSVGIALHKQRLQQGISQAELGQRIEICTETIANWEHGRSMICRVPKISEFLGYNPLNTSK